MALCKLVSRLFRLSRRSLVLVMLLLPLSLAAHQAVAAGVTAVITQGWPQSSPDHVTPGEGSTLLYIVTISGLNPHESVASQIASQSYFFMTDADTLIDGNPESITVKKGAASTSTFTISLTGSSQAGGAHTVAFQPGEGSEITLTNGSMIAVTAGTPTPADTFTVSQNVVTVHGDPYCVIPANSQDDWASDVASTQGNRILKIRWVVIFCGELLCFDGNKAADPRGFVKTYHGRKELWHGRHSRYGFCALF